MQNINFYFPPKLLIGIGKFKEIGEIAEGLGKKALVVTGKKSMKREGHLKKLVDNIRRKKITAIVYDEIIPNPTKDVVDKGAKICRENKCDLIIALGGGSVLDSAKGIAVVAKYEKSVWDYIGANKVPGEILPIIAIPTTAGTGSEATPYSVFSNPEIKAKEALVSHLTYPKISIIDPELMVSMNKELTADTGMDALCHAVEAFTSRSANPVSDIFAREAIKLAGSSLRGAVYIGEDLAFRYNMALAACYAGIAIAHAGVGAAHGFGMIIGGLFNTSHGRTVGVLLPYVMKYNLAGRISKFQEISSLLGEDISCLSSLDAAEKSIDSIFRLLKDIKFPLNLSSLGIDETAIDEITKRVYGHADLLNNPVSFTKEEIEKFLKEVI